MGKALSKQQEAGTALNVPAIQSEIAQLLKFSCFEPECRYWLDTGSEDMNAVLGSREKGLAYGKLYELFGPEHGGKTTIGLIFAALAQQDGAGFIYVDLEDSRDETWASRLGVDWERTIPIYPKIVLPGEKADGEEESKPTKSKKQKLAKGELRLQGAEELFKEAEVAMQILHQRGFKKQFLLLDSVANLQTVMQSEAGATGQNMRTQNDRALVLAQTLPRWCGKAANYNVMMFLLNQVRQKVGLVFGDPETTTGGRALKHNCSVRAKVHRVKNGRLISGKRVIGIHSQIDNRKNKAGHGSVEHCSAEFKVRWDKDPVKVTFMPIGNSSEDE